MSTEPAEWERERQALLGRRISELGLEIAGSPLEPLVRRLYDELGAHGLVFRPQVYLSDEWGCPSGVPLIGVPFYLADPRLTRLEATLRVAPEGGEDALGRLAIRDDLEDAGHREFVVIVSQRAHASTGQAPRPHGRGASLCAARSRCRAAAGRARSER